MTIPNPVYSTRICRYGAEALREAALLIRAGEPVAVPTETVYGLAADATDESAVAAIYSAKGRPSFNPLIVHVSDKEMAERLAIFSAVADKLAARFWPGALTMVLPVREDSGLSSLNRIRSDGAFRRVEIVAFIAAGSCDEMVKRVKEFRPFGGASDENITPIGCIALPAKISERRKLVQRAGNNRLGHMQSFCESSHGMRPRADVNGHHQRHLPVGQVGPAGSHIIDQRAHPLGKLFQTWAVQLSRLFLCRSGIHAPVTHNGQSGCVTARGRRSFLP